MQPALHVKLSRYQGMRTYKQSQFSYRNVSAVLIHALDGRTESYCLGVGKYLHLLLQRLIRRDMPKVSGSAFGVCRIDAQA